MLHVPYRGTPQAITDLLGGTIDVMSPIRRARSADQGQTAQGAGGRVIAALTELPDVPTLAESGYPGFEMVAGVGAFGPAKTPPDVT